MRLEYTVGSFKGVPIIVHASVLLAYIVGIFLGGLLKGFVGATAFIVLMVVHEVGHAYFILRYKHRVIDIRIYPIHGVCQFEYDAWVRPEFLIHAGGVLAQIALMVSWILLMSFLDFLNLTDLTTLLMPLSIVFVTSNLLTMIVNLIPVKGLDGYEIWGYTYDEAKYRYNSLKRKARNRSNRVRRDA